MGMVPVQVQVEHSLEVIAAATAVPANRGNLTLVIVKMVLHEQAAPVAQALLTPVAFHKLPADGGRMTGLIMHILQQQLQIEIMQLVIFGHF